MRYCPTCRLSLAGDGPPYTVVHTADGRHLHPVTREQVAVVDDEEPDEQR